MWVAEKWDTHLIQTEDGCDGWKSDRSVAVVLVVVVVYVNSLAGLTSPSDLTGGISCNVFHSNRLTVNRESSDSCN